MSLKNRKNRPALGAPPPDPLDASSGWGLRLQTPVFALRPLQRFCLRA